MPKRLEYICTCYTKTQKARTVNLFILFYGFSSCKSISGGHFRMCHGGKRAVKKKAKRLTRRGEVWYSKHRQRQSVLMARRIHPFPSRTRKLSYAALKILGGKLPGKIGRCRHKYSSLAQLVEHAAVNRRVVGSSPTGGAKRKGRGFFLCLFFSLSLLGRINSPAIHRPFGC